MCCYNKSLITRSRRCPNTGVGPQAPDEFAEGAAVYAKNKGNVVFYVDRVLGNGKYKLRRGGIKGKGVLDEVFDEKDLQEERFKK